VIEMGEMAIMGIEGDKKEMWDPESPVEVGTAKATYDKLIAKGYKAFSVKKDGEKGKQIYEFDPDAGKIILVPEIKGG